MRVFVVMAISSVAVTEASASTCFQSGTVLRLIPGSRYDGENGGSCGPTTSTICLANGWHTITWNNGYTNEYVYQDLELCQALTTTPASTTATTRALGLPIRVSGFCPNRAFLEGVYTNIGFTATGSPLWASVSGYYIYHDLSCNGAGAEPRWIIDNDMPDPARMQDLDNDGSCTYYARISSTDSQQVPSGTWRMVCDGSWTDVQVTVDVEASSSGTSTSTTLTTKTATGTSRTATVTSVSTTDILSTESTSAQTTEITTELPVTLVITGEMSFGGVNYTALDRNANLKEDFRQKCARTIAAAADTSASRVRVTLREIPGRRLSSGSVTIDYSIELPPSSAGPASSAFTNFTYAIDNGVLGAGLVDAISSISGIDDAVIGSLTVNLSPPAVGATNPSQGTTITETDITATTTTESSGTPSSVNVDVSGHSPLSSSASPAMGYTPIDFVIIVAAAASAFAIVVGIVYYCRHAQGRQEQPAKKPDSLDLEAQMSVTNSVTNSFIFGV